MKASMGLMMFALAIAASACTGAPQYGSTPNELDSGITLADRPAPDALVPVLGELDAGAMAAVQTGASQQAVPQPVATGHPIVQ